MSALHEIRADYDANTIVVYQAYPPAIADAALEARRFVPPFSFQRMTWIKPSFLWLMHRSNWGLRHGQERILAVRISRVGWEKALGGGVLTSFDPKAFVSPERWEAEFREAKVHIQWDTERSLRGAALTHYSIQVGISRHLIREFVEEWIVELEDLTPRVRKMDGLLKSGSEDKARRLLPAERVYPIGDPFGRRLLISKQ